MDQEWSVPAWALLVILFSVVLLAMAVAVLLTRSRARAAASAAALREQIATIERRLAVAEQSDPEPMPARSDEPEYVVTTLGRDEPDPEPAPVVPGPLFADLVLREGVVQVASLAAGLRRALAPETRHRIRFEMRREVKRARKQRRADLRAARRELEARQRSRIRNAA